MTTAANAFVATHIEVARGLGRAIAAEIDDPTGFVRALRDGLASLADADYLAGSQRIAPGIGPLLGIRLPLLEAVHRALVHEIRGVRAARLVPIAEALARDPLRELRWFSCWVLAGVLADDPERAWQVMRGLAAEADDWITVDTLATSMGTGILLEPYRWAELEQLVYSPSRWERRLVGSTIATIPFADRVAGRTADVVARSLALVGLLIGDPEPDVQKSLSWALRNMAAIDRDAVTTFCRLEAERAASTFDGSRAWVVRDTFAKLAPADVDALRALLAGIRRTPGAANTSSAAATAAAFIRDGLPDPRPPNPADLNRRVIP